MSEKKVCFVIGPIGDSGSPERSHADWLFDAIIKPVFAEHFSDEFEDPVRADKIVLPGSINTQIITRLLEVPLVIADMSLHNANAFYELAIRHWVNKPTIHIYHKDWKPPFDMAGFRAISFSRDEWVDVEKARAELKSTVEEAMKPGRAAENPITLARGVIKVDEHASSAEGVTRVYVNKVETLERQFQTLARALDRSIERATKRKKGGLEELSSAEREVLEMVKVLREAVEKPETN